jgi:hypothetical protein
MKDGMDHRGEFGTCMEDLLVAEAMNKGKSRRETGSPFATPSDVPGRSKTDRKSGHSGQVIVETLLKAHRCSDCAIRRRAAGRPQSVPARIHRWHKSWWPGWKIHQTELRTGAAGSTARTHFMEETL